MCGIVGLHLRTPRAVPPARGTAHRDAVRDGRPRQRLRRRRGVRRPDLVATRTGLRLGARRRNRRCRRRAAVTSPVAAALGSDVDGVAVTTLSADGGRATPRRCSPPCEAAHPQALVAGFGSDIAVLKGVGHPRALTDGVGTGEGTGMAGRRPHPDGHRIGRDTGGLPPLRGRARDSAWCTTARSPTTPPSGANCAPPACISTARTTPRWAPGSSPSCWPRVAT